MIFHVIAQHDHTTCGRVKDGVVTKTMDDFAKSGTAWVEGSEDVTVLGVWGYPVSHRIFVVVEADTFEAVTSHFEFHLAQGPVEVLPVRDLVQSRKDAGFWGQR
jgi:hypothetical protein|tara:strand:+ start:673 stop:984 length:312 start_codon:yes stop_codon:yes gene_type:complete